MTLFAHEPALAQVVANALVKPGTTFVLVAAQESDAQRIEEHLRQLCRGQFSDSEILFMPWFVQTGVYRFESSRKTIAKRLATLQNIHENGARFVVCSMAGFVRVCPSFSWLERNGIPIESGSEQELDVLLEQLAVRGYMQVQRVEEVGEFSLRGSILDLWTPGQKTPTRLEFFADSIDKIRSFRVSDQRSFEVLTQVTLLPAREFVWPTTANMQGAVEKFNVAILTQGLQGGVRADLLENVRHGVPFAGIDDVSSLFTNSEFEPFYVHLKNLLAAQNQVVEFCAVSGTPALQKAADELERLYENAFQAGHGKAYVSPKLEFVFPHLSKVQAAINSATALYDATFLQPFAPEASSFAVPVEIEAELAPLSRQKFATRAQALARMVSAQKIQNLLLLCRSRDSFFEVSGVLAKYFPALEALPSDLKIENFQARSLMDSDLKEQPLGQNSRLFAAVAALDEGFYLPQSKTLAISEGWLEGVARPDNVEVYTDGANTEQATTDTRTASEMFLSAQFADFTDGDLVVHVQHGIARFKGLVTIKIADITGDFLALGYAGNDKVYVPVHKLNLVQKYLGSGRNDDAVLDSLKSGSWEKRKQKAREEAVKLARELMEHNAKRATTPGHAFSKIDEEYMAFEAAFPFDETPDQVRAIREIHTDMAKPKAMDRLLCGDVGFGKTEVAMRAAYRCVLDGKQVSWLVPTTVLAHQHYRSLKERFAEFGVGIEILDRSQGTSQSTKLLERVKNGSADIVVGTHRLLSKDIAFRDLGLLIVDEEQRFGVLQKEKIKSMSYGIDVLTMSATPIPRTLQMAMIGLRDMSLLTTPPKARLAVKTFVCPYSEETLVEAITSELARGGQLFYVHNRVEELPTVLEYLKKLVPQARICVGHGRMGQKELDDTMIQFLENRYDILLCTTIIESGIDMPNVNTIIVQNADNFGLAQLYQLRGRVGRRSTRGYAYFVTSPNMRDEDEGAKRLEILKEHQELGSGFVVASHDLEMRGSGNVLGDEQSGRVSDVGLETYTQMLDDAIKQLGGLRVKAVTEAEIQIPLTAQIPEDYITNSKERLRVYRRFFGTRSEEALQNLVNECEDRFGPIPESVRFLAEVARMRRWLIAIGALALVVGDDVTEVRLSREVLQASDDENSELLVKRILDVCNRQARGVRLTKDGRILLPVRKKHFLAPNTSAGIDELKRFLSLFAGD